MQINSQKVWRLVPLIRDDTYLHVCRTPKPLLLLPRYVLLGVNSLAVCFQEPSFPTAGRLLLEGGAGPLSFIQRITVEFRIAVPAVSCSGSRHHPSVLSFYHWLLTPSTLYT